MNNEEVEKNSQNKKKISGGKDGKGRSRRKRRSRRRREWRLIWRMGGGKSADWGINKGK